ncbi:transcriptional regulator, LysR family [Aquitalea magnusonii]|uniref:Transcriptional regulator, LysR family n=1 Tax=Aquitalea magnusonii TaxID=332411 RepID=A0A3G9GDE2_9NEIS|nr:LysR family transcriptional regulator [Aquitalea magnusonii]BBF85890.1 transcriptional regulator, LysR family [Aquitalea magnusonii]
MVRLEDLHILLHTAQLGSLSAAARALDISPAVASAALKRLESELGTHLLVRSTRSLRLTADGERYLEHARTALDALQAGAQALAAGRQTLQGQLSLSMPSDIGRQLLRPWLDAFLAEHPGVRLQLHISDRLADLYRMPVDVALRYGVPEDSSLVALPMLPDNRRLLCAAPSYLAAHGWPQHPEDLTAHACLRLVLGDALHERWRFARQGEWTTVLVGGRCNSDDGEIVRRWAVAGQGIAYKSRLDVLADVRAGRLLPLLTEYQTERAPLYLVCPHRMMLSPLVVRLREFLQLRLQQYVAGSEPVPDQD